MMFWPALSRVHRTASQKHARGFVTELNKVIFVSTCKSDGREGTVESVGDSGSNLKLNLEKHVHAGGKGEATNPEELFAAGYSACFNGALQFQAAQHKIKCGPSVTTAAVSFGTTNSGVGLAVKIHTTIEGVDYKTACELAELAHSFCPYSKATIGNISVEVTATGI